MILSDWITFTAEEVLSVSNVSNLSQNSWLQIQIVDVMPPVQVSSLSDKHWLSICSHLDSVYDRGNIKSQKMTERLTLRSL